MKNAHGLMAATDQNSLKGLCDKHVSPEWRAEHNVDTATAAAKAYYRRTMKYRRWADSQQSALAIPVTEEPDVGLINEGEDDLLAAAGGNKRKKALLQKKIWRLPSGAPIVPHLVYNNVENALVRFAIRKRKEFVAEACKYWTLKREARRGANLIKRLQLQLENYNYMDLSRRDFGTVGAAGRQKLLQRIEFAKHMEDDTTKILDLCQSVLEREQQKLQDANLLRNLVDTVYFPVPPLLWPVLERILTWVGSDPVPSRSVC
jgi:NuA3 HAT complex component NTO1